MILCMVGAIDLSSVMTTKNRLQQATDAAALSVSATTSENPNTTEAKLQILAANMITANFGNTTATLTDFHVCAPVQQDCTTGTGTAMPMGTVSLTTTVRSPCYIGIFLPGVCTGQGVSMPITANNTSNIGYPANIQMNMLLDVSGSMIVGATPNDVTAITNWVSANWSQVNYAADTNQGTPCAFACHDEGPGNGSTHPTTYSASSSDMQLGLTNAHKALMPGTGVNGVAAQYATTRFDVMIAAAKNLVNHVQTEVSSSAQLAKNSYFFNVYSMADSVTAAYTANTSKANDYTDPVNAINGLQVGLDTHFNESMSSFTSQIGSNGTGNSNTSPLKFVILVTDGVESDFYKDFYTCTSYGYDGNWSQNIATGCFAAPFSTTPCNTMKNNGIVLAVLETPYVPLTGQDPKETLYEAFVRSMIYPGGPSASSTVSAALQACASSGYYFQANSPSDIASGFTNLTDKFLASAAFIKR